MIKGRILHESIDMVEISNVQFFSQGTGPLQGKDFSSRNEKCEEKKNSPLAKRRQNQEMLYLNLL